MGRRLINLKLNKYFPLINYLLLPKLIVKKSNTNNAVIACGATLK